MLKICPCGEIFFRFNFKEKKKITSLCLGCPTRRGAVLSGAVSEWTLIGNKTNKVVIFTVKDCRKHIRTSSKLHVACEPR